MILNNGERTEDKEDILQEQGMQEAHLAKGDTVQEREGQLGCSREASLRSETIGLWRSDQTRFPQEGQDHQKDCLEASVPGLQACLSTPHQEMQAL